MAPESDGLKYARRRIQRQMEQAELEKKSQLRKRRMELVRQGAKALTQRDYPQAVINFLGYLKILEEVKEVGPGGLVPSLFDRKTEMPEIVLVSSLYWDLAKIYDRSRSAQKRAEFLQFLDKYILFAVGMPHQPVCTETLRKYIRNDKPLHSRDFRNAYKRMGNASCFVVTSLLDLIEPETLPRMWSFRDRLEKAALGRAFVALYYQVGPVIAFGLDRMPLSVRRGFARVLDEAARRVTRWH